MKSPRFRVPLRKRPAGAKWLSLALLTLLSVPSVGFATPRGATSPQKFGARAITAPSAPPAGLINVNRTSDEDNPNPNVGCDTDVVAPGAQCTLRAAIQRANVLTGDDQINFNIPTTAPNCDAGTGLCTINLTKALPDLSTNVRIEGPGADKLIVRRDTGGEYNIFKVTSASEVTLSGLRIEGGKPPGISSGGAIANIGGATVNVVDSILANNTAGAIAGSGGAISNDSTGTVNINNTTIDSNQATGLGGGIYNAGGTLNVTNSIVSNNTVTVPNVDGANGAGGGISNGDTGTVNVTNSIISGNRVLGGRRDSIMRGGGIYNFSTGTVTVANSALIANVVTMPNADGASGGGGGIANGGTGMVSVTNTIITESRIQSVNNGGTGVSRKGGGLYNVSTGTMNVTNTVLLNNDVVGGNGGGVSNESGSLNVTNSTITQNRSGIFGHARVKSTIIAGNGFTVKEDVSGSFTSEGFNLVGVEDGSTGFNAPTDQKGTLAAPLDPKFDPNVVTVVVTGQPISVTALPLCSSPARDKGSSAGLTGTLTTDLRGVGFPRTIDDPLVSNAAEGTDAGALERQSVCLRLTFTVNTTGDADDLSPGDGACDSDAGAAGAQCSLRAAMREANARPGDYIINFAIPTADPGFDRSTGRYTINLTGALPEMTNINLTISGPGASKLTVRRSSGGFYRIFTFGGLVETVTISGLTISNGLSEDSGGGVSFSGTTLTLTDCMFIDNIASNAGGGVMSFGDRLNVSNSTFRGNFSGNSSGFGGGGAIFAADVLTVTNSTFSDNGSGGGGGAILNGNTNANVESSIADSTFTGNNADAGGGVAVGNFAGATFIHNCTFRGNSSNPSNSQGGGIYHSSGTLNLSQSTITGNEGFGIASAATGDITTNITHSTISGNTGGGILKEFGTTVPTGNTLNVTNSTISGNTGGAGIHLFRTMLNVTNSTISNNETGGITAEVGLSNPGTWTVKSSIIAFNGSFGDVRGAFTSGGFNLIGKTDGSTGFTAATDQKGTIAAPLDPKLDPAGLRNNGGPTQTIGLQPASPAIDKGTANGLVGLLAFEQRGIGFPRIFNDPAVAPAAGGDNTDIGAFELQPVNPLQFGSATYSVNENAGTATINVTRSGGGAATINYATSNGTAMAGSDYTAASGTLSFANGETTKSFSIPITNDSLDEANETVNLTLSIVTGNATIGAPSTAVLTITDDDPTPPTVQLSQTSYSVNEGQSFATITVTRAGDTSGAATVKYGTSDMTDVNFQCNPNTAGQLTGAASRKCDYHIASGRLRFAAGESTKQIILSVINDVYVEGNETLTITLSNPTGIPLGANSSATVSITDNDLGGAANPIDGTSFYVRQLYVDLLSREPDAAGLAGWINRIDLCGQPGQPPPPCDRVTVGGDGFLRSAEFFDRQFFVLRLYRTGLGRILLYPEVGDLAYVSGFLNASDLELNKHDLVAEIMSRSEFGNQYNGLTNATFVDALLLKAGVTVPQGVRDDWVTALNGSTKTRAQVYREISERQEVSDRYLHEAQVVSAYYGFFTRNPDGAYFSYLSRLDNGEINLGDLANAFINASEYRQRFGP